MTPSRRLVVLAGLIGAGLTAVSASQAWGTGTATAQVVGVRTVTATGGQLAPHVPGLALVGAAAAVAAATTGRLARRVALAAMALAGVAVVAAVGAVLADLAAALGRRAAELAASSSVPPMTAAATPWPWVAALGGLLVLTGAVLGLRGVSAWPGPSSRYDRTETAGSGRGDATSLWERVSRESDLDGAAGQHAGGAPLRQERSLTRRSGASDEPGTDTGATS